MNFFYIALKITSMSAYKTSTGNALETSEILPFAVFYSIDSNNFVTKVIYFVKKEKIILYLNLSADFFLC